MILSWRLSPSNSSHNVDFGGMWSIPWAVTVCEKCAVKVEGQI